MRAHKQYETEQENLQIKYNELSKSLNKTETEANQIEIQSRKIYKINLLLQDCEKAQKERKTQHETQQEKYQKNQQEFQSKLTKTKSENSELQSKLNNQTALYKEKNQVLQDCKRARKQQELQ